jgi:hypothetical protein
LQQEPAPHPDIWGRFLFQGPHSFRKGKGGCHRIVIGQKIIAIDALPHSERIRTFVFIRGDPNFNTPHLGFTH